MVCLPGAAMRTSSRMHDLMSDQTVEAACFRGRLSASKILAYRPEGQKSSLVISACTAFSCALCLDLGFQIAERQNQVSN